MLSNLILDHSIRNGVFSLSPDKIGCDWDYRERIWTAGNYLTGEAEGQSTLGGFDYELYAQVIGADLWGTEENTLGGFIAFGSHEADEHDLSDQRIRGNAYSVGLYQDHRSHYWWNLSSLVGYTYSDIESYRTVTLGSLTDSAMAKFRGHAAFAGLRCTTDLIHNERMICNRAYWKLGELEADRAVGAWLFHLLHR